MAGGYNTVVTGTAISASAHNEYVRDQVASQFATASARDSAITAPVEGMLAATRDTDQLWMYTGSAWVVVGWYTSTGRVGVDLSRAANQSIANNSLTAISWDTETSDPQGFITATSDTLTIPSGYSGIYMARLRVTTGTAVGVEFTTMNIDGTDFATTGTGAGIANHVATFGPHALSAAQAVKFYVRHQIGSSTNMTFGLQMYRLAA